MKEKTPVLVTTEHRGVFFGYLASEPTKEKVTLTGVRNILEWSAECRGFMGLAVLGPVGGCRVGPRVEEMILWDITGVAKVSSDAVAKFEEGPWRT